MNTEFETYVLNLFDRFKASAREQEYDLHRMINKKDWPAYQDVLESLVDQGLLKRNKRGSVLLAETKEQRQKRLERIDRAHNEKMRLHVQDNPFR